MQEQPTEVTSPSIDAPGIKCVQAFVGAVFFYIRSVDKKVLLALNTIGTHQDTATESTNEAINNLLDYLATYPNYVIVYKASSMVLATHVDTGFHNESKVRSRTGAHVFLSED